MANYHYRATDAHGQPVEGELNAPTSAHVEARLQEMGLWLIHAHEKHSKPFTPIARGGKVKSQDLLEFSTHMFTLLDAGIPLPQALNSLSRETPNLTLRKTLQHIYQQVEAGSTLHAAMGKYPGLFPVQMVNLIQAGEESGTLKETFKELERYLDWLDQIRGEIRQATIYPTIVIVAVIGLLILLFTFVIPRFVPILRQLNTPLPFLTQFLIGISEVMLQTWWVWSILVLGLPFTWLLCGRYLSGFIPWRDRLILNLPLFGELNVMLTLSKFAQNFAVLYRAGIPILQCLELCQGLVGNKVVAQALRGTQQAVAEGATISESLSRYPIFPPMMIQMINIGETTGKLPQTLANVATFYNREIPRRVKKIFAVLEPAITLGLIGIVGTVALALFMPLMSLMDGFR